MRATRQLFKGIDVDILPASKHHHLSHILIELGTRLGDGFSDGGLKLGVKGDKVGKSSDAFVVAVSSLQVSGKRFNELEAQSKFTINSATNEHRKRCQKLIDIAIAHHRLVKVEPPFTHQLVLSHLEFVIQKLRPQL